MRFDDRTTDCESHTEALHFGSDKRLKYALEIIVRDSGATIANCAHDFTAAAFEVRGNGDPAFASVDRRHGLTRIHDQVQHYLLQLDAVAEYQRQVWIECHVHGHVSRREVDAREVEHVLDDIGEVDGLA